jgi:hypothetical protein
MGTKSYYESDIFIKYLIEQEFNDKKKPEYVKQGEVYDWLNSLANETP